VHTPGADARLLFFETTKHYNALVVYACVLKQCVHLVRMPGYCFSKHVLQQPDTHPVGVQRIGAKQQQL
jgi:hypothetical protein